MEVHTTDTQTNPAIQPSLPPPSSVVLLGKVKAAHHTCDRPVARDRRVPLCVAEIAARAQRLLGDPHPTLRSWVRTTYGRARIAAPIAKPRLRAKPVLVVRLVGTFPQGGSPPNPYGRFREVRFQVDPATRRVVGWQTVPVETMTPLPPLGRLGHSHRF
jgi:hypothetical protein